MNKRGLITAVAERCGTTQRKANELISIVLDTMCNAAIDDGVCAFGNIRFRLKKHAERRGRNPNTGEALIIPEKKFIVFRRLVTV